MKKKRILRQEICNTRFEAKSTEAGSGIKGVLVISEGPAKGHFCVEENGRVKPYNPDNPAHEKLEKLPVFITSKTLEQVAASGNARTEVKAKLDHGTTIKDIFGGYSNFTVENGNVRADLHFLEGTPHQSFVEGIASRFADEFGNSIDFESSYEIGKDANGMKIAIANCLRLASIDLVDSPAATNSLFEEQDSPIENMLSPEDLAAIGKMISDAIAAKPSDDSPSDEMLKKLEDRMSKLEEGMKPAEKTDEEKKKEEEAADAALAAKIEKAALSVVNSQFTKLSTGFVKTGDVPANKDATLLEEFETAVKTELSTGAASRAAAIRFVAAKKPDLYNHARQLGKL